METFKDIPGYKGLYQVSDCGNVKSLLKGKEKVLSLKRLSRGYSSVVLTKDSYRKTYTVHKLVAMAFLGHIPCGYKLIIDHIDFNKLNNHKDNLRITTNRDNLSKDKWRGNHTSKYTGVSWYKRYKKWQAQIVINKKKINLGYFKNELEARDAYQTKLAEL